MLTAADTEDLRQDSIRGLEIIRQLRKEAERQQQLDRGDNVPR
jgi:hypothetical protein